MTLLNKIVVTWVNDSLTLQVGEGSELVRAVLRRGAMIGGYMICCGAVGIVVATQAKLIGMAILGTLTVGAIHDGYHVIQNTKIRQFCRINGIPCVTKTFSRTFLMKLAEKIVE